MAGCWMFALGIALAAGEPASPTPVPEPPRAQPAGPVPPPSESGDVVLIPPRPIDPLVFPWPDMVAPRGATAVPVELLLHIDATGAVAKAETLGGAEPFASAAAAHVLTIRFSPAIEAGVPVPVEIPLSLLVEPPPINVDGVLHLYSKDGPPAPGLLVHFGDRTDTTALDGSFAFRGVPPGAHTFSVEVPGFVVPPREFTIGEGEIIHLDIAAQAPDGPAIMGVYRIEREEVVRRSLSAEELRTTPGTMGDPLRAIANLPGAVRTPLDAGWLLIRGGDPRDTGVYIDGVRVPLIYHLGGFTSVVHPGFIDRVDFLPGGQSARYGRSTAGVVDLITRPRPEDLEVRAGANIVLAGAFVAVPIGNGGISAGFRRSYLDFILRSVPGVSDTQAEIAPRFWDWQARADAGPFSIFGLGYIDTIDASTGSGEQLTIAINTQRVQGTWEGDVLGKQFRVKPYFGYELRHIVIEAVGRTQDRLVAGPGVRAEWVDEGAGAFGWSAGVDALVDDYGLRFDTASRYGVFVSPEPYGDVRFGTDLKVIAGLRADTLFATGQLPRAAVSPRVSVTWPFREDLTFVADAGVYHQPPAYDLLMGPPEGTTLRLERAWGGGAGARAQFGPIHVDLDLFGRRIDNLTGYEEDGSLGQGDGLAFGAESMTRLDWRRISGWVTYSVTRSLRREGAGLEWTPAIYDQPHSLVIVAAYDMGRSWTLAGRWRYASGFPVPCEDCGLQAYDILRDTSVALTGDENGRLEPFHALDLKIAKRIPGKHLQMEAYLDIQNVYWRRIAEPVITGFADVYSINAYGFGLPTLPILGIEGSWRR